MLLGIANEHRRGSRLGRYGLAVVAAVAGSALRVALEPWLGPQVLFATSYPAVVISGTLGGVGPGLTTTLLCTAGAVVIGTPSVGFASPPDVAGLALLLVGGGAISALTDWPFRARRRAELRLARLEADLRERKRSGDELAIANSELQRRLGEREWVVVREQAARAEAQRRQREAQAATRARDQFLAVLGHELRNPLGAISSAIRALHETGDKVGKLQDIIGRQSQHLARLLDDLLDISRVTMGKITLNRQPVDLREIAERVLAVVEQESTTEREVTFVGVPVVVDADPMRLEQVARNLLDNAVKYTPAGGRIDVAVGPEDDMAVLRISDSGIGIPADVLPHIFQPFVQAEAALHRSMGGLGLGLSVVSHIVELHGGSVSASSAGPGRGSEFVVRLPLHAEAAPLPHGPMSAAAKPGVHHVLLIEDNVDVRHGLGMLLETWGHQIEEAGDGRLGLEMALTGRADIAFINIGLPVVDGYGVARGIRADARAREMFLVAVTGYGRRADVQTAHAAGFDAVLVKPIDPDELMRALARADEPR